jgi:hypothetical protein
VHIRRPETAPAGNGAIALGVPTVGMIEDRYHEILRYDNT